MDVDDVYKKIGEFGPSQKKITFFMLVLHVVISFPVLLQAFIGVTPKWSCKEDLEEGVDSCSAFEKGRCTPVYSPEFTTVVTEWDLICSKSSVASLAQSLYFLGSLVGSWVFGALADKIGRRKVVFLSLVLTFCSGLGYSLAPSYQFYMASRLLTGMFVQGQILSMYVLTLELMDTSKRTVIGLTMTGVFALGFPILSLLAYNIRSWRTLCLVCTLAMLPCCLAWWAIPESPRWLMVTGKMDKAKAVLSKLARGNGLEMPEGELRAPSAVEKTSVSTLDLFKGKVIRFRTSVMFVVWFANSLAYYGLSMAAGELGGGRYISFSLSGLVEIPSFILAYYCLGRFGRKWSHAGFLSLSGAACLLWTFLNVAGSGEPVKMLVALTGKFAVAGSFSIVYLYAAEVFPTQVRNVAMGVVTIGARTGGILSPMVLLLSQYSSGLPMFLIGAVAFGTGVLSLSLPETLGQPMPETLAELETSTQPQP